MVNNLDILSWENLQLSNKYQLFCKIVASVIKHKKLNVNTDRIGFPHDWYNGAEFHSNALKLQSEMSSKGQQADRKKQDENNNVNQQDNKTPPVGSDKIALPIDKHEEEICKHIRENRITVIHGETGCGKSTRIPQMIAKDFGFDKVQILISQPKRIAAKSLKERVATEVGPKLRRLIGLRMGGGVQEDTKNTHSKKQIGPP